MSDRFVMLSQMVEANGKTVRENRLAIPHNIILGALVEILPSGDDPDYSAKWAGIRLFVRRHSRDCDGSPLYDLGTGCDSEGDFEILARGFSEEELRVLRGAL